MLSSQSIAGKEIQTFSHSDLLIYLCLNGFKDGSEILRSVCDVAGILHLKFSLAINYRDTDVIQLPKPLHFLYHLIRPLRIIRDYRQNLFKFLVK